MEREIAELIVSTLNLEIGPDDIDPRQQLFGAELALDSIDALELGVMLSKRYGLRIDTQDEKTRQIFFSIETLAKFAEENGQISK